MSFKEYIDKVKVVILGVSPILDPVDVGRIIEKYIWSAKLVTRVQDAQGAEIAIMKYDDFTLDENIPGMKYILLYSFGITELPDPEDTNLCWFASGDLGFELIFHKDIYPTAEDILRRIIIQLSLKPKSRHYIQMRYPEKLESVLKVSGLNLKIVGRDQIPDDSPVVILDSTNTVQKNISCYHIISPNPKISEFFKTKWYTGSYPRKFTVYYYSDHLEPFVKKLKRSMFNLRIIQRSAQDVVLNTDGTELKILKINNYFENGSG